MPKKKEVRKNPYIFSLADSLVTYVVALKTSI